MAQVNTRSQLPDPQAPMKRLQAVLGPEEIVHCDKSLDASAAPTDGVRLKIKTVRDFMDANCFMSAAAEANWGKTTSPMRQRVLSELIWRAGCILDKSVTAVQGMSKFDLGFGFRVQHTTVDGREALVIL